jgi:hypothetical protein
VEGVGLTRGGDVRYGWGHGEDCSFRNVGHEGC